MKKKLHEIIILAIVIGLGISGLSSICKFPQPRSAIAQPSYQFPGGHCTGYQTLTPNSTSVSTLTQTSMGINTTVAWMTVETGAVRFWVNGTSPTTSVGMKRSAGDPIYLDTRDKINNFKVISISTHGVLQIQYCE